VTGEVFDCSRTKQRPFVFQVGQGRVIRGWDEGIPTMSLGENSRFYISSDYAYGSSGVGGAIPPNATLIFDVKLLSFE
jgi:FKBP-type peptidyl-prolyl cis-trans isomerase